MRRIIHPIYVVLICQTHLSTGILLDLIPFSVQCLVTDQYSEFTIGVFQDFTFPLNTVPFRSGI